MKIQVEKIINDIQKCKTIEDVEKLKQNSDLLLAFLKAYQNFRQIQYEIMEYCIRKDIIVSYTVNDFSTIIGKSYQIVRQNLLNLVKKGYMIKSGGKFITSYAIITTLFRSIKKEIIERNIESEMLQKGYEFLGFVKNDKINNKKIKFDDLPKITKIGNYEISVSLTNLKSNIDRYIKMGLQINPDFQRGHIWNQQQQILFVEFVLKGGQTSPIYFNHPNWMNHFDEGEFVIVDGLQRLTALLKFINNEFPVFSEFYYDNIENIHCNVGVMININNLKTRKEVLQWYLEMNENKIAHTEEELNKVRTLIQQENDKI